MSLDPVKLREVEILRNEELPRTVHMSSANRHAHLKKAKEALGVVMSIVEPIPAPPDMSGPDFQDHRENLLGALTLAQMYIDDWITFEKEKLS